MNQNLTDAAGQALADAIHTANTRGLDAPETEAAAQVAHTATTAALQQGATPDDIRRAGGLPTR